jgi:hypothetical protein
MGTYLLKKYERQFYRSCPNEPLVVKLLNVNFIRLPDIVLLLTSMASIIDIVRKTKSHEKQHSRKYGSIAGLGGIETNPSADIIALDVGVGTMRLLGAS